MMRSNLLTRSFSIASLGFQAKQLKGMPEGSERGDLVEKMIGQIKELKGLPGKVGQMIAMSSQRELDNDFMSLVHDCEAIPLEQVLKIIEREWGLDPYVILEEIEPVGLSASLGQVHRATLKTGGQVAIKIQYPGIKKAVRADARLLNYLSIPFGGLSRGFDLDSYKKAIQSNMDAELSYIQEMENQAEFSRIAEESSIQGWVVPELLAQLCTDKVLVSVWEGGQSLQEVCKHWSGKEKRKAQKLLAHIFMHSLFREGMFHADPNPGNYAFRKEKGRIEVITYDFGSVGRQDRRQRINLLAILWSSKFRGTRNPYPLYLSLGFSALFLEPLQQKLPALTELLSEPFFSMGQYDLKGWKRSERAAGILHDDRWNFRIAAPADALLLVRAFTGLFYYLGHLKEPIWLTPLLEEVSKPFQMEIQERLKVCEIPEAKGYDSMAKHLKIKVSQQGQTKVQLAFSRSSIERIEEIIPPEILTRIQQRKIDLGQIVEEVRKNQYQPQALFHIELEKGKQVEVWLE